jgi:outer membrane protein assembly factor BamB
VVLIGAMTLPAGAQKSATSGSPPMFRENSAHTGVSSAALFAGQGGIKWRTRTGDAVRSSPAVTADRIFIGSDDGKLYALERQSGQIAWRFEAGGPVSASPAVARGLVVAASVDGRIFAVEETHRPPADGTSLHRRQRWPATWSSSVVRTAGFTRWT